MRVILCFVYLNSKHICAGRKLVRFIWTIGSTLYYFLGALQHEAFPQRYNASVVRVGMHVELQYKNALIHFGFSVSKDRFLSWLSLIIISFFTLEVSL